MTKKARYTKKIKQIADEEKRKNLQQKITRRSQSRKKRCDRKQKILNKIKQQIVHHQITKINRNTIKYW